MVCWEGYPREHGQESEDVRKEGNKADKEAVVAHASTGNTTDIGATDIRDPG